MMCISVVEPAALWLRVWVCGVEKGPSGDLWTELERRRNGGLAREKDEFHLDLLGRSVRSLYIMIIWQKYVCSQTSPGWSARGSFPFFFWKGAKRWMPAFRPRLLPVSLLAPIKHCATKGQLLSQTVSFFFFQTKVQLIYNVVLISGTQQSYSVIYIIFHYGLSQHFEYSSLCYQ